jgi:hypothetical protein
MMREKICLPVHKGRGLRIAGCGTFPSHVDRNIRRFITSPCKTNSKKDAVRPQASHLRNVRKSSLPKKESKILEAKGSQ